MKIICQRLLMRRFQIFGFKHRQLNVIAGLSVLFCLWLELHPYLGLYHDARLYAAQALYRSQPDLYQKDLFFAYGSQDQFTIFSLIYSKIIQLYGLDRAVYLLTLIGQLLWFGASALLVNSLTSGFVRWLALLLITTVPGFYGADNVLVFGEAFLTARLYAEAFSFTAIVFAVNEKWLVSFILLILALLIHPLMALSAILILLVYQYSFSTKLYRIALIGALAVALAACLGIAPFDRLLLVMNENWRQIALRKSPWLALENWTASDWALWVVAESTLILAWLSSACKLKRLFFAAIIVGLFSTILAFIGGSLLKNALLLQIQLWRALWLVQWFAFLAFAWLVNEYWHKSEFYKSIILILISSWLMRGHEGGFLAALTIPAWFWQKKHRTITTPLIVKIGVYLVFIQALAWYMANAVTNYELVKIYDDISMTLQGFLEYGASTIVFVFFLSRRFFVFSRLPWITTISCAVAGILLVLTVASWDHRRNSDFPRLSQSIDEFAEFKRLIPKSSTVYWEGNGAMYVWLILNKRSYVSDIQTAGVVFSEQNALEGLRRAKQVWPLSKQDSLIFLQANPQAELKRKHSPVDFNDLKLVCQDSILNFVVYPTSIFGARPLAIHKEQATGRVFYLYDCKKLGDKNNESSPL